MSRQTLQSASLLVVTAAVAGKVVGFLREVIIARQFGTGEEYDTFLAAIVIPSMIYTIIWYGLPNLLVPVYARRADKGSLRSLWIWFILLTGALTAAVVLGAETVLSLVVPGLSDTLAGRATGMLRAYSVMIFLSVIIAGGRARLEGRKHFIRPAIGPASINVVVIGAVYLFAESIGAYAIVWSTLAGTLLIGLWYWWPTGDEQRPAASPAPEPAAPLGKLALGVMAAAILSQMFFVIDRWWGSFLLPGSISALRYGTTISNIPVFIVGTGLAMAIFPFLSEALSSRNEHEARQILGRAARYLVWIGVPLAVVLGLYGRPLVGLFLERGRFDAESTALTVRLLPFLALGIIPYATTAIWEKVYYAQRWLGRLFVVMLAAFTAKFILSWVLVGPLDIDGLALATGLSYLLWGGLMFAGIRSAQRPFFTPLFVYFLKVALLTVGGGVAGYFLVQALFSGFDGGLLLNRIIHLTIGVILIWGPLLLIDGHWGINERRKVWEAFVTAIRRVSRRNNEKQSK